MTNTPNLPTVYGTVSGQPVTGNVQPNAFTSTLAVTLTANYARNPPPGYPRPDAGAPLSSSLLAYPQTIASGTTLTLFSDEAAALVGAGAATYS